MRWRVLLLAVVLVLAGCAAGPTPIPDPKPVQITLANGSAQPNGERVELTQGQHLVLTITSDRADKIHVHGYDLEIPVAAGETVTKDIVVDQVGRFEVESHDPVLTILQLIVS